MIPGLRGVVEERTVGRAHDLVERQFLVGRTGDQAVEVVHIGFEVLAIVVFEGLPAHLRSKCFHRIGKLGQRVFHLFEGFGSGEDNKNSGSL